MHNDYVRPNGLALSAPFVQSTFVVTPRDMARLDELTKRSINGDEGGDWVPTTPICVGGAGLALTNSAQIIGGVETRSGGRLFLGDNDFPLFSALRTRSILVPMTTALGGYTDSVNGGVWAIGVPTFPASSVLECGPTASGVLYVNLDKYVHNNAHLMSATLTYQVQQQPSNVVTNQIIAEVGLVPKTSTSGAAILAASLTPASPHAHYADGNVQTLGLTLGLPDGTINVIDRSTYTYVAAIICAEGAGTTSQLILHSLQLNFAEIADMRFQ